MGFTIYIKNWKNTIKNKDRPARVWRRTMGFWTTTWGGISLSKKSISKYPSRCSSRELARQRASLSLACKKVSGRRRGWTTKSLGGTVGSLLKTETASFFSSLSCFDDEEEEPKEWEVGIEGGDGVCFGVEVEVRGVRVWEKDLRRFRDREMVFSIWTLWIFQLLLLLRLEKTSVLWVWSAEVSSGEEDGSWAYYLGQEKPHRKGRWALYDCFISHGCKKHKRSTHLRFCMFGS